MHKDKSSHCVWLLSQVEENYTESPPNTGFPFALTSDALMVNTERMEKIARVLDCFVKEKLY